MGRAYAGILGPLAYTLAIARGATAGWGVEGTLLTASGALFLFAAVGYVMGRAAEFLVSESVRVQFQAAMAAWDAKEQQQRAAAKAAA